MAADFGGLLAKAKAPSVAPMPDVPDEEGGADPLTERVTPIAQDLLEAVRGGDVGAIADALIAANKAISAGPSDASTYPDEGE